MISINRSRPHLSRSCLSPALPKPRVQQPPAVTNKYKSDPLVAEVDVVVIGAGVGGLACAALLAKYGLDVSVLEAHSIPGGCAHGWTRGDYHFDSGTSLFFGLEDKDLENPLVSVLSLVEEDVDMISYTQDRTSLFWGDRRFDTQIGSAAFSQVVQDLWGDQARLEWIAFQDFCRKTGEVAASIHPMAVRYDGWIGLTTMARSPLKFLQFLLDPSNLSTATFDSVVDRVIENEDLKDFVDYLCQGTSGLGSKEIMASYMIRAFNRIYQSDSKWEIPLGGSQRIVDALVRGLRKFGGRLHLNKRVDRVVVEKGRAVGVKLTNGRSVAARKAVVSNATVWDTQRLMKGEDLLPDFRDYVGQMEVNSSFMHLHMAFEGDGLPDLPFHTFYFDKELSGDSGWPTMCIPTSVDSSLAPEGKHILHVYQAEHYDEWKGMDLKSKAYEEMKVAKSEALMELVRRVVPDIDDRVVMSLSGSPLTHERFLNRIQGTYGTKNLLKIKTTPTGVRPLENVYCVGDSTFPGTGTPAVAAAGMWVSNTLASVKDHWLAMDQLSL